MKQLFVLLIIICIAAACTKSNKTGDPTEDLKWLKAKKTEMSKNCICVPSIWSVTYKGETIYQIGCSGPTCFCAHMYYDKGGNMVKDSDEKYRQVFLTQLSDRKLLWSCNDK